MTQQPFSGQPVPVMGITGGPPILGGGANVDPVTGNIILTPPGGALEVHGNPGLIDAYEYFNSNTDFSRLTMETALGGPDLLGIVSAPSSVTRDLNIEASGNGHVFIPQLSLATIAANKYTLPADVALVATTVTAIFTTPTVVAGVYFVCWSTNFLCPTANTLCQALISTSIGGAQIASGMSSASIANAYVNATAFGLIPIGAAGETITFGAISVGNAATLQHATAFSNYPASIGSWVKIG